MSEKHTPEPEERFVRPFADVLREIRRGDLHDELSEQLADVVEAVEATKKAGKLTLVIAIKPEGSDAVVVTDEVKPLIPKPDTKAIFFARGGVLMRNHPDQGELPLGVRVVDQKTGEIKEAN